MSFLETSQRTRKNNDDHLESERDGWQIADWIQKSRNKCRRGVAAAAPHLFPNRGSETTNEAHISQTKKHFSNVVIIVCPSLVPEVAAVATVAVLAVPEIQLQPQ